MATVLADVLGAIAWSPEIRNILAVSVGIAVLCGSVYLIVATNTGMRTGLLVALAGLFGWMAIMGVIWWMYGIGMQGSAAHWVVEEVNYTDPEFAGLAEASNEEARRLTALADRPTAQEILEERPELAEAILPPELEPDEREARKENITLGQLIEADPTLVDEHEFDDIGGWSLLAQSDRQRGDAVAAADHFLGPEARHLFESPSEYLVLDAFSVGGKDRLPEDPSRWDRIKLELESILAEPFHPTHYALVQVRAVIPQCEEGQEPTEADPCYEVTPGEAPPPPVVDEDAPVVNVIMVRDLGDKRFPAFMVTLVFGGLFAVTCWSLHRRDAVIAARRAAPA